MDAAFFIYSKGIDDPKKLKALRNDLRFRIRELRPTFWFVLLRNAFVLSFITANIVWLLVSSVVVVKGDLRFPNSFFVFANMGICISLIAGKSGVQERCDRLVAEWREICETQRSLSERDRMLKERIRELKKGDTDYFARVFKTF